MSTPTPVRRLRPRVSWALQDAVLAAVVGVVALIEPSAGDSYASGPPVANVLITGTVVLLLALRRAAPVRVLLGTSAVIALPSFLVQHDFYVWSHMVPLIIETYTVARHRGGRVALTCLAGVFPALAVVFAVLMPWDPQALLWSTLFFGVVFVGHALRRSATVRAALRDAGAELEAGRRSREQAAVLRERARLALELQDTVSLAVALMTAQAATAERTLDADPDRARSAVLALERAGREATADLRRMLGLLRTEEGAEGVPALPAPRLDGIDELVSRVRAAGAAVTIDAGEPPADLPAVAELGTCRLVQDVLTGALGRATDVATAVRIRYGADIELLVTGTGATASPMLRDRAAVLGGTVDEDAGALRIRIPVPGPV